MRLQIFRCALTTAALAFSETMLRFARRRRSLQPFLVGTLATVSHALLLLPRLIPPRSRLGVRRLLVLYAAAFLTVPMIHLDQCIEQQAPSGLLPVLWVLRLLPAGLVWLSVPPRPKDAQHIAAVSSFTEQQLRGLAGAHVEPQRLSTVARARLKEVLRGRSEIRPSELEQWRRLATSGGHVDPQTHAIISAADDDELPVEPPRVTFYIAEDGSRVDLCNEDEPHDEDEADRRSPVSWDELATARTLSGSLMSVYHVSRSALSRPFHVLRRLFGPVLMRDATGLHRASEAMARVAERLWNPWL